MNGMIHGGGARLSTKIADNTTITARMIKTGDTEPMGEPTTMVRRPYFHRPTPLPPCLAVVLARILSVAQLQQMTSCLKIPTTLQWRRPIPTTRDEAQARARGIPVGTRGSPVGTMIRLPVAIHMQTAHTPTTPMIVDLRLIVQTEGGGVSRARARALLALAIKVAMIATIVTITMIRAITMLTKRNSARIAAAAAVVLMMIRYFIFTYYTFLWTILTLPDIC